MRLPFLRKRWVLFSLGAMVLLLAAVGCDSNDDYFLVGSDEQKARIEDLLEILEETDDYAERVVVVEQIAGHLRQAGFSDRMRVFLTGEVERHSENPFNAYLLLLTAESLRGESPDMARHYYSRLLANYPDVTVRGNSVHFAALRELVEGTEDPESRIRYYEELIDRFPSRIDLGRSYYYVAKSYEELGEWDSAFEAYKEFLRHPNTRIAGYPDAHLEVAASVNFYDSAKDWTMESLETLVSNIKDALYRKDVARLLRYRAKENFFAMSWEQEEFDFNSQLTFNLGIFLARSPRIQYASSISLNSNAQEAYLRTWGWSYRINTWYLYFRRVDFPADPSIHGTWEWAGIFFGEAL
ncbi:MAG: tetratricopeptide repeat protein [Spirochaetaceae bacterium]